MCKVNGRKARSSKKDLFSRECKCTDHDIVSVNGDVEYLYTLSSNDYNKRDWSWLIENGKLTKRNTFVCNLCLDYAKKNCIKENVSNTTQEQEQNTNSKHDNNEEDEIICNIIKATIESLNNKSLSEQECSQLCISLVNYFNMEIFQNSKLFMDDKTYKKPTLIDDVEKYLDLFPVGLVQFLTHITKYQKNTVNRRSNQLALIIEDIYATRNSKYVDPLRFSQGHVKWSLSGSKTADAIDKFSSACGSITTLQTFLNENAKETINECFPENDVDILFADNTQKKGKTTCIKEDGTTPLNVARNVVFLQLNPPTNYQSDFSLSPRHWLNKNGNCK